MDRRPPLVIAHRGASGYRPEHSRMAYELAFDLGCDAVEPDVVATGDGVLVVRHENEISGTTDVADRPEFADRRTTKRIDGVKVTGWFTEDFTWAELATLRVRERLPGLRPGSAGFDGSEPMLRLTDVLELVAEGSRRLNRGIGVVLEVKHDTYLRSVGIDIAALVERDLREAGWDEGRGLVVESFELSVLQRLRERGVAAQYVYLIEARGAPADQVAAVGDAAPSYADAVTPAGLDALVGSVDGVSVAKSMLLAPSDRPDASSGIVVAAHERGLLAYTWTCRPENAFLDKRFRSAEGRAAFGDYLSEWALIRGTGVDGVFVDHTDLGVAFFRDAG